jgi:aspartate carbamoyltransferase catalytic subunit
VRFHNLKHVISCEQFTRQDLDAIFVMADWFLRDPQCSPYHNGADTILATLFYEPSTRTRLSFEAAQARMRGQTISTEAAGVFSSHVKGESLEDTIRVVSSYADAIVLRHPDSGAAKRAALVSPVPIINAGDGDNEHPTQALLDLYTIHREVGLEDGRVIALAGDVRHSRTIHSLLRLLALFPGVEVVLAYPDGLGPTNDVLRMIDAGGLAVNHVDSLGGAVHRFKPDVVYMTRLQTERHDAGALGVLREPGKSPPWGDFCLTKEMAAKLGPHMVVMHPLPRREEIPTWFDSDPRAAYFRQAAYGLPVRMALLSGLYHRRRRQAAARAV